jgi:hypothetical protein
LPIQQALAANFAGGFISFPSQFDVDGFGAGRVASPKNPGKKQGDFRSEGLGFLECLEKSFVSTGSDFCLLPGEFSQELIEVA